MSEQLIYQSAQSRVHVLPESQWGIPVVRKTLSNAHPPPRDLSRFYNEFDIQSTLDIKGTRKVLEKSRHKHLHALYLEYVEGETLAQAFQKTPVSLLDFLELGCAIASVIGDIHTHNGWDWEKDILMNAFEEVSRGATKIVTVAGYSGTGKSVLVHEVHKPVTEKLADFVQGKFDQFQRSIPYFAIVQAFREYVAQVLTESDSYQDELRVSLHLALGAEGKIRIVDNPTFPAHEFFAPGREFPVRIRHATATFYDDAMNGIRSMSVKFSHHHFDSPFDLELNTGAASLFWSAASFMQFPRLQR